jgi:hypothetical protein
MATRVAPTVVVIAQTATAVAVTVGSSPLQITDVRVSPDDTTITIQNMSASTVNVNGWTLLLGPNIQLELKPVDITAGTSRMFHVGPGTDTATDVYLGSSDAGVAMVFAPGQRAVLVAPGEQVASIYRTS